MATNSAPIRNNTIRFQGKDAIESDVQGQLKHRYSSGIYIQDVYEASSGDLAIELGNAYPKDVSDCRNHDNVLKFINIGNVATLKAEPTGEDFYVIELPERRQLYEQFRDRKDEIMERLDWSMAKTIYENVFELPPVRNQLNSIIQIMTWVREQGPLSIERINSAQGSQNTFEYLEVLEDLGYLSIEEGEASLGERVQSADIIGLEHDDYIKGVIGDIVQNGYHVLKDRLDLRMLSHYPKFSNAYYYSAIQRNDPDLWLDIDTISDNLDEQYGETYDSLVINDKLNDLANAGVLNKDGGFVKSNESVYSRVSQEVAASAL